MNKVFLEMPKQIWALLIPLERRAALVLFFLMMIGMGFEMLGVGIIIPVITGLMNPDLLVKYPGGDWLTGMFGELDRNTVLFSGLIVLVSIYAFKTLFLSYLAWSQANFTYGLLSSVSGRLFRNYLFRPYEFHLEQNSANLIRNAVTETQVFALNVISPAISLMAEGLVLVGLSVLLVAIEPMGSIFVVTIIGTIGFGFHWMSRRMVRRWGEARQVHEGRRIKTLQEGLSTIKEVILLDRAFDFMKRYDRHAKISATAAGRQVVVGQLPRLWLEFIAILGIAALVGVQTQQGRSAEDIFPVMMVFAAAAFRLMPSVNRILIALNSLHYGLPVLRVLHGELGHPASKASELASGQVDGNLSGAIQKCELSNVSLSYPGASQAALRDVSLTIAAGEMVGLVGPSGSGKSTLVDVLLGLLRPTSGAVLINEMEMDVCSREWKQRVGYVPQSIVLTDNSVRRNVAFGLDDDRIDDGAVLRALRAAQMEEFVNSLPDGLDTVVGERGVRLSGGQRQRIGVARALYSDPEILVLDEATSALDGATESGVMEAIRALHGLKTVILVAHRLTTVAACDRLYRLDKGCIADSGTPAELLGTGSRPEAVHGVQG